MNYLPYAAEPQDVVPFVPPLKFPETPQAPQATEQSPSNSFGSSALLNTFLFLIFTHIVWLFAFLHYVEKLKDAEQVSAVLRHRLEAQDDLIEELQEKTKAQSEILQELVNHKDGTDQSFSEICSWRRHQDKAISQLKSERLTVVQPPATLPARLLQFNVGKVLDPTKDENRRLGVSIKYTLIPEDLPKTTSAPVLEWHNQDKSQMGHGGSRILLENNTHLQNNCSILIPAGTKCYLKEVWLNGDNTTAYKTELFQHLFDF